MMDVLTITVTSKVLIVISRSVVSDSATPWTVLAFPKPSFQYTETASPTLLLHY